MSKNEFKKLKITKTVRVIISKLLLVEKHYVLGLIKHMELLKLIMELDIWNYLVLAFIMEFMVGLIIL